MSEVSRIGDHAKIRRGASPRPIGDPKYFGGTVGWVRISDVASAKKYLRKTEQYVSPLGESMSVRVDSGDLIMSICATIGRPVIVEMPACIHDGFVLFYDVNNDDKEFMYYLIQYHEIDLEKKRQPGTQVNLNTTIVENFKAFFPTHLAQQRKIARILSTVDAVIEKTEAAIAKYQAIKAGMMQDLFTRGIDPATGRLRPSYEEAPELYKKSELGWVPREWEVVSLNAACSKIQDGTHFSPQTTKGPFMYLTSKNIRFGFLDISNIGWISEREHTCIYKRCDVNYGDILLTKDGANTGNVAFNSIKEEYSLLSSVAFLRCDEITYHNYFLFQVLLSPAIQQVISDLMSGNAITRLTLTKINAILVPKPSYSEQCFIAQKINAIHTIGEREESTLEKNKNLKQALMSDPLTGKVRVKYEEESTEAS